jgi:hypothetical protein
MRAPLFAIPSQVYTDIDLMIRPDPSISPWSIYKAVIDNIQLIWAATAARF